MVYNKVRPTLDGSSQSRNSNQSQKASSTTNGVRENSTISSRDFNDFESISTIHLEESSYLKLKPFTRLDPTLNRLLKFLDFFNVPITSGSELSGDAQNSTTKTSRNYSRYVKLFLTFLAAIIPCEVVYDVNLRQSRLLAEQKRSTPLLTFVIVVYSWLTLVIPLICDISLIFIGPYLFRYYSRTTATVCNGMFFGKKTPVDTWYYYTGLVLVAFLDVVGQMVLLGVWPKSIDTYMRMVLMPGSGSKSESYGSLEDTINSTLINNNTIYPIDATSVSEQSEPAPSTGTNQGPKISAHILDFALGPTYAHSDLGVIIKIICLLTQCIHTYAFLIIIISLAAHYATAINSINENLEKYEFRRLLKQLIILRDSSEQISLMISLPFSLIIMLVFMRQIALSGVFIQSTMQPYENWAVSLQFITCSVAMFMVFIYCDSLQNASKQTHRLKTEQTVINENRGGNQSIYEFLDYLDRLSKSIRITFFNIIAINKSSLVGLFGHILTLTFVTS